MICANVMRPSARAFPFDPPDADPKTNHPVALLVHWRGQSVRFDLGGRDEPRLPGMLRHEDWFRLMPMVEGRADNHGELLRLFEENKTHPRLIAAARYPAAGYDDQTWGLVRRREWRYRFAEFKVDGPPEASIRTWDTTYGKVESAVAPGPHDKPVEGLTDEQRNELAWQYDAMIQVTPSPLFRAKDKVVQQGMDAMSWTWPVAGVSVMGMVIGALVTFGRGVERHD